MTRLTIHERPILHLNLVSYILYRPLLKQRQVYLGVISQVSGHMHDRRSVLSAVHSILYRVVDAILEGLTISARKLGGM